VSVPPAVEAGRASGPSGGRRLPRPERWAVVTVLACGSAFLVLTALIAVPGPVRDLDWAFWNQGWEWRYPGKRVMTALTVVGQRGPALVLVVAVVAVVARRLRSWRPLVVLAGSQLLLNVVVGGLKYGLGRAKAETGSAELFAGGTMFPSGHSSNAVVVWGVLTYVLVVYGGVRLRKRVVALAAVPSVIVAASTLFIGSHWVTDVVGGVLVGVALLAVTITLDRGWSSPGRAAPPSPAAVQARAERSRPAPQEAGGRHLRDDDDEPVGPAADPGRRQTGAGQPSA
jgi:membrane-associated phospholipid phosphatase